jgi:hypothetical protein
MLNGFLNLLRHYILILSQIPQHVAIVEIIAFSGKLVFILGSKKHERVKNWRLVLQTFA